MVARKTSSHNNSLGGSFLSLALALCLLIAFASAQTAVASVCPEDFFLLELKDGSEINDSETPQRRPARDMRLLFFFAENETPERPL